MAEHLLINESVQYKEGRKEGKWRRLLDEKAFRRDSYERLLLLLPQMMPQEGRKEGGGGYSIKKLPQELLMRDYEAMRL